MFPALLLAAAAALPPTTNNNDTCDIAVTPAATLLLPYFEVDFRHPRGAAAQTLVTIENISPEPHIANMTLWTDWAHPALNVSLALPAYGMQTIDLYELFARGAVQSCGGAPLPASMVTDLQLLFTAGRSVDCAKSGGVHANAIGYATIDVVADCTTKNPSWRDYYAGTILFDNVLTGDYEQIDGNHVTGGPLVHIRAVPEGGAPGAVVSTNLPYTFYDRYTIGSAQRTIDRRQPLPSAFAARYVNGPNGATTNLKIWREGTGTGTCSGANAASLSSNLWFEERIRFDEHENATFLSSSCGIPECPPRPGTAALLWLPITSDLLPPASTSGDIAGWLYLNLNNGGSPTYSVAPGRDFRVSESVYAVRQSQNWVITSMVAGSFAAEMSAVPLGNGCTPAQMSTTSLTSHIRPAANSNP